MPKRMALWILLSFSCLGACGGLCADDRLFHRWQGSAQITFSGTSTLHDWKGQVTARPFQIQVETDSAGKPAAVRGEVVVEAAAMDTAEPKRDENMHRAMKVREHPLIRGVVDMPFAPGGKVPDVLTLKLDLLGREQIVPARVSRWTLTDGKASFDLDFDVSMKAGGIKVPPVLFVIRVGDAVQVHAAVTLIRN